jgi:hypothetical protein
MFALGKCNYTEAFVRIMGAMAGGLVAFPLFKMVAEVCMCYLFSRVCHVLCINLSLINNFFFFFLMQGMDLTPLGGPEFNPKDDEEVCS